MATENPKNDHAPRPQPKLPGIIKPKVATGKPKVAVRKTPPAATPSAPKPAGN